MKDQTKSAFCDTPLVERPRYFARQLITPDVMTMEQDYFRNRMRLHNRMLHGWGVVCGALVTPVLVQDGNGGVEPWKVRVCPGYVLGPEGDEIIIACEHEVDLRQGSVTGTAADPCSSSHDQWCSDYWIAREPGQSYYIAVRYKEMPVRPQRVQPAGCGCDESRCEFSRLCDGYEIGVLSETDYQQTKLAQDTPPAWGELFQGPSYNSNPTCLWPCSSQRWVVLARVDLDDDGRPESIDNCGPRRLVAALGRFHWTCTVEATIDPEQITQGASDRELTITGQRFQEGLVVDLGKGISVVEDSFTWVNEPSQFSIRVNVASDAAAGSREVMVINPDCSLARASLEVLEAGSGGGGAGGGHKARQRTRTSPAKEDETAEEKPKRTRRKSESQPSTTSG
jgi:hypothetical protein